MSIDKTFKVTFAKSDCGSVNPLVIQSSTPK